MNVKDATLKRLGTAAAAIGIAMAGGSEISTAYSTGQAKAEMAQTLFSKPNRVDYPINTVRGDVGKQHPFTQPCFGPGGRRDSGKYQFPCAPTYGEQSIEVEKSLTGPAAPYWDVRTIEDQQAHPQRKAALDNTIQLIMDGGRDAQGRIHQPSFDAPAISNPTAVDRGDETGKLADVWQTAALKSGIIQTTTEKTHVHGINDGQGKYISLQTACSAPVAKDLSPNEKQALAVACAKQKARR